MRVEFHRGEELFPSNELTLTVTPPPPGSEPAFAALGSFEPQGAIYEPLLCVRPLSEDERARLWSLATEHDPNPYSEYAALALAELELREDPTTVERLERARVLLGTIGDGSFAPLRHAVAQGRLDALTFSQAEQAKAASGFTQR